MLRSLLAVAALSIAIAVASTSVAFGQSTDERSIDPGKSSAQFGIAHIFVERVTGTVPIVSGTLNLPAASSIPAGATAVLDASRIKSGDHDRDSSLTSADYFDTQKYPTWTFTSTKITASGPASFGMDGSLTIHGVTQPEHLDVTVRGDASHLVYHAVGHVDRRAFGLKGTRLDPVIGNVADVTLDIVLK